MKLTDAYVLIDGDDVSEFVQSVSLPYGAEMLDTTAMGDGTRKNAGGLKTWSIDLEMKQDFGATGPNAVFFPLVGEEFSVEVRPTSAARSSTNPAFVGTGCLEGYTPIDGSVGDLATTSVTIQSAGTLTMVTA